MTPRGAAPGVRQSECSLCGGDSEDGWICRECNPKDWKIRDAVALITAWDRENVRWDDMPEEIIRGFVERYYAGREEAS